MIYSKSILVLLLLGMFVAVSCDDDDGDIPTSDEFTLTIQNVFEQNEFFSNGTSNIIMPGMSGSFSFHAGQGHYLSFASMFGQSNDLFFAPDENGIPLYDGSGNALTGDITSMIDLWDAGTEVNEEPGAGPNQAPRQSAPNTGPDENGTVRSIYTVADGFSYAAVDELIEVSLTHDGGTMFTINIDNTSNNTAVPTPLSPPAWVVHFSGQTPLFETGTPASGELERIAEEGNKDPMDAYLSANSGYVSPIAPGAYSLDDPVFNTGTQATSSLESLAEEGDPSGFMNIYNTPTGASGAGPILPGQSFTISFTAEEGDRLSFASMLGQSNDWFFGADDIDLYTNGNPISGDITNMVALYDAGTEVDEYAGAGNNQAPRQPAANTGPAEGGNVQIETNAGGHVPSVANMIRVTIDPN